MGNYPIYVHNSIANLNEAFENAGVDLPKTIRITPEIKKDELQKGIVIVPPALADGRWIKSLTTTSSWGLFRLDGWYEQEGDGEAQMPALP
jgi:putative mRNA 3-end processing factor